MINISNYVKILFNNDCATKPSNKPPYTDLQYGDIIKVLGFDDEKIRYYVNEEIEYTNYISKNSVVLFKPCKCKILKKLNGCNC